LLREAVKNDDADFGKMDEDADLDPVRDEPAFAEIMKAGNVERRYAAVWSSDASFEAIAIYGLDPAAQEQKCRELIAQGYRPASWSASRTTFEGPLVTASVWHRPVVSEEFKDRLAERQARAAVALVRMGKAEEIWPLLRHSADPRLRSFIINWLKPLGADPKLISAEFDRLDSAQREADARLSPRPAERGEGGRRPGEGSSTPGALGQIANTPQKPREGSSTPRALGQIANTPHRPVDGSSTPAMDAILFHPETSMRRALIQALGAYGSGGLSPGEREPQISELITLYRNDPDSGIHGAAEWTLRKWGQQDKLKDLDAQLKYAWYQANSKERPWSCGSLLPNDLGLFDVLGNELEWVQDRMGRATPRKRELFSNVIYISEYINYTIPRFLRGGPFFVRPAFVRSADRGWFAPSGRLIYGGFRSARTYD
jgi:Sulfatase-modifying factor enzyme 1